MDTARYAEGGGVLERGLLPSFPIPNDWFVSGDCNDSGLISSQKLFPSCHGFAKHIGASMRKRQCLNAV